MIRILFISLICLNPYYADANLRALLKGLVKSESKAVVTSVTKESAQLLRHSDEFVRTTLVPTAKELSVTKSLYKGVKKNMKEFTLERLKDIMDLGVDFAEFMMDPNNQLVYPNSQLETWPRSEKYFKEIISHPSYPSIYNSMCKHFQLDTLSLSAQFLVLNGAKWRSHQISTEKLYRIYLIFSITFAKEELLKLRDYYNCDQEKNTEINNFADKMKIKLPKSPCPEDDGDWAEVLFGLIFLLLFIYFIIRILKWLWNMFQKINKIRAK
jgi:flagellar biogenesis protein FliO